jgi:hypothetical protein
MQGVPARLPPTDEPRQRSLSPVTELAWYVVAGVTYIAAGSAHKALLTWLVGPAWVVATLWFGPIVFDAAGGALDRAVRRLCHAWAHSTATRRDTSGDADGHRRWHRRGPP